MREKNTSVYNTTINHNKIPQELNFMSEQSANFIEYGYGKRQIAGIKNNIHQNRRQQKMASLTIYDCLVFGVF